MSPDEDRRRYKRTARPRRVGVTIRVSVGVGVCRNRLGDVSLGSAGWVVTVLPLLGPSSCED
jgi:hypothetical protein